MSDLKPFVTVAGATARAAVHSLARAGYGSWAADLFADRDLARFTTTARCPLADYPHALPALVERFPPGPVIYSGGLENHPDVVAALAARRPLWGNPPDVLRVVRDPFFMSRVWPRTDAAVRCPAVRPATDPPRSGAWLVKPRRGAGGDGIRRYAPADPPLAPDAAYLQEFIAGVPMSALFVAGESDVLYLGAMEQLVGDPWLHAGPFQYAGNVGPVALPKLTEAVLWNFGRCVARAGRLVGLFGVDFQYADGIAYPVEINPRYTASVEVFEFATDCHVMSAHAAGCERPYGLSKVKTPFPRRVVGKAVYYAPHRVTFPAAGPWDDWERPFDPWNLPAFADVPDPGGTTEPGWPVLTLLEGGSSPAGVRARLQSRAVELDRLFAEDRTR